MQDSGFEGSWKALKPDAVPRVEGSAYALQTLSPLFFQCVCLSGAGVMEPAHSA